MDSSSSSVASKFSGDVALLIESLSLTFHGHDPIVDSEWQDFLGLNGCGKSTLLTAIRRREIPIPEHMDIFHLIKEIEASDMSSLEAVINYDEERMQLEKEVEVLDGQNSPMLEPTKRYLKLRSLGAPAVLLSLAMQGVF
ncbi:ABC transporter F family member 1-like [Apium graveolens]|uniref:ABC transporter F family member 1-like n=1 Tax=Apium graveolens TaxID=4045 RepID=UPI003D7B701A